ncbi:hypothetical protein Efla_002179 [Eimeria flavescens]
MQFACTSAGLPWGAPLRRPPAPRLQQAEAFSPELLRQHRGRADRRKEEEEDGLEQMMERLLRRASLPSLPRKGSLFGKKRGAADELLLGGGGAPSRAARVNKLRCRVALQVYALLDPLNAGYVDPETACSCIVQINKENKQLADLLLHVLEDMLPFISPRGVIEKDVFLFNLQEWINADISGLSPYNALRTAGNMVSAAFKNGMAFTTVESRRFYEGTYTPRGLQVTCRRMQADGNPLASSASSCLRPAGERQRVRAAVEGHLCDHIEVTAARRREKLAVLKEEARQREMAECTFKPQIGQMPSFGRPFPARRELLMQKGKAIPARSKEERAQPLALVERQLQELETETALPPEDPALEKTESKQQKSVQDERPAAGGQREAEVNKDKSEEKENKEEKKKKKKALPGMHQADASRLFVFFCLFIPAAPSLGFFSCLFHRLMTFDVWVIHHGNPKMKPMQLEEYLRVSPLPAVPLDGLTDDSPRMFKGSKKDSEEGGERGYLLRQVERPLLTPPYTLGEEALFPHLTERQGRSKQVHQAPPPLTPGLRAAVHAGFVRERIRESEEERRIRLGRGKSASPPPAVAAEMRILKKKLQTSADAGGTVHDPLLWKANLTDFEAGTTISQKREPRTSKNKSRRNDGAGQQR